jgi:CRISPR/Cas system CSM-associated protein Csm2 small subunit
MLMESKQTDELFQLLEKYELSIGNLYENFAQILPGAKDAWMVFANEERLHAKWINRLYEYVKDGKIELKQTKVTSQSTKTAIDYIENQIGRTSKGKPDLKQFLDIAIDIEKSLLESSFFRLLELSDPKTQKIRVQLEEATRAHIQHLIDWRNNIINRGRRLKGENI